MREEEYRKSAMDKPKSILSHYKLFPLAGHTDIVRGVAWSPDGKVLASCSEDDTVKLWDGETRMLLHTLAGHTGRVWSVAWAPDGHVLASGAGDNTIKLWDVETGTLLHTLEGHTDIPWSIVMSIAWAPDGKELASGADDNTIKLWDGETGELLHTLEGHTGTVNSVAWTPDGKELASGSGDHTIKLWDAETRTLLHTLEGHTGTVNSVAWTPDGKELASGSSDHTIKLWDAERGELLQTLEGHTNTIWSVAWAPEGKLLASGSGDNTIKLWDAERRELLQTLEGHTDIVGSVAWAPDGKVLASGSDDNTIKLWDAETRKPLFSFVYHTSTVNSVAWTLDGKVLASCSEDNTIKLWDGETGRLLQTLEGHTSLVNSVVWAPYGKSLVSGAADGTIKLWDGETGMLQQVLEGHSGAVNSMAWAPYGKSLVSGAADGTIKLWDGETGMLLQTLEGHTSGVNSVAWVPGGKVLASGADDHTVKLWDGETGRLLQTLEGHTSLVNSVTWASDGQIFVSQAEDEIRLWRTQTWEIVEVIRGINSEDLGNSLYFFPHVSRLAALSQGNTAVQVWDVDVAAFRAAKPVVDAVHYTTAKIALVGDSSVGKSGLGYRIAEGDFRVTESTHGQQFWVVETLGMTRADGTICEAVLWDFAGQPNFRPIHTLFLEDIELALVLFDPSRPDTLAGVDYWLKQLAHQQQPCHIILVAARSDVSKMTLTTVELEAFCRERQISGGFVVTSAKTSTGIELLVERIQQQIDWNARPTTITTNTFKRVKDYVLALKADTERENILVSRDVLQSLLEQSDADWRFSEAELMGSVQHLQNHGYVTILRQSSFEQSILLMPDVLINLASRYMLRAQDNEKGLGALEEERVLSNGYRFDEVERLADEERATLLNAVTELFLSRNICFRESVDNRTFLIFPSLIFDRPPKLVENVALVEDMAYLVGGQIENVYAALAVLLGYSPTFKRVNQWRKQAQYETMRGEICGFKLVNDDSTELELVLYYGKETPEYVRARFQGLFEEILHSRLVSIKKYAPLICPKCGTQQERSTVIRFLDQGETHMYCVKDGRKLRLPKTTVRTTLSKENKTAVQRDRTLMGMRTSYETALSSIKRYRLERGKRVAPTCFISYAWGDPSQEKWVMRVADDLRKADLGVVLDRWDNAVIGANIARFIERMVQCDFVLVVGTPAYLQKHENMLSPDGSVVAAEMDLINRRFLKTEPRKESVLPLLLDGTVDTALPPFLRGRVYANFTHEEGYFVALFDLLLTLYAIPFDDPLVQDMRKKLHDERDRWLSGKSR